MPCLELGPGVHICRPDTVRQRVPGRRRKSWWCFKCRRRTVQTLMWNVPTGLSYYGPTPYEWECPLCHEEHVLFPGREWVEVEP